LSANWAIIDDTYLTVGANRYYAANMVGYAIRSHYPDNYTYKRKVDVSTGAVYDWQLDKFSTNPDYSQGNLNTPYSDELTAALTFAAPLDGSFRIKGVYRQNRDNFAKKTEIDPVTKKTTRYSLSNDGKSDYKGLALEWQGQIKRHSFNANITWSETKTFGEGDYFTDLDPQELVYYQGQLIGMDELYSLNERSNFGAPLRAALGWTASWTERLQTNTSLNYRGGYDYLGNTGKENVDGINYDRYEQTSTGSFTTVNLNGRYQLPKWREQQLSVDMRVTNLFNRSASIASNSGSSSAKYQLGRSVWLGMNYAF
ncbi:TonB-dependent receptor domain-containing protein, partial [Shewanella sp.]|uniref:TonB-dependent receptor domain-containing protein n=1 Tax=Shewanella sp. TaxID=50422 RepID=UPI003F37171D